MIELPIRAHAILDAIATRILEKVRGSARLAEMLRLAGHGRAKLRHSVRQAESAHVQHGG